MLDKTVWGYVFPSKKWPNNRLLNWTISVSINLFKLFDGIFFSSIHWSGKSLSALWSCSSLQDQRAVNYTCFINNPFSCPFWLPGTLLCPFALVSNQRRLNQELRSTGVNRKIEHVTSSHTFLGLVINSHWQTETILHTALLGPLR